MLNSRRTALMGLLLLFVATYLAIQKFSRPYAVEGIELLSRRDSLLAKWRCTSREASSSQVFKSGDRTVLVTFVAGRAVAIEGKNLEIGGQVVRVGMAKQAVHRILGVPTQLADPRVEKALPGRDQRTEIYKKRGSVGLHTITITVEYKYDKVRNILLAGV